MRIIVYEHMSSGGYANQPISVGVLSEGFGMLRTVISDFKAVDHELSVLLDSRISKLNPPINADYIVPISHPHEVKNILTKIASSYDAALVIAPETGQTLQSLVEIVEKTGRVSLNSESKAISKVANKAFLYQVLERNHLPTPKTLTFSAKDDLTKVKRTIKNKLSYPLIFKPLDGVSCIGLSIVKDEAQVKQAIKKIKAESAEEQFVVQEFIEGEATSVSLLCVKGKALAISLNQQTLSVGAPDEASCYEGGLVPFDHQLKQEVFELSEKVVGCFDGLRGYVGVDLILAKDKLFVVDVNPRLTTSYVGLSRVANFNVAGALVTASMRGEFPTILGTKGYVSFTKLKISKQTLKTFEKIAKISEVVSPPFPLKDNQKTCALIVGKGDSMEDARIQLEEAKKRVLKIISGGK